MTKKSPLVISITSGKGGVGKTNISVNLAYIFGSRGLNTLLLDADLGLGNVDVLLGINPQFNVFHLLSNQKSLNEVIYETDYNFSILPAPSGLTDFVKLSPGQKLEFLDALDPLEDELDIFLVDTGAGINDNVLYFNMAAQYRVIIITPEPTSLTDGYALIKILHQMHKINDFHIIINLCKDLEEAKNVFKRLYIACDKFLNGVSLNLLGYLSRDKNVTEAVKLQIPFCMKFPETIACKNLNAVASNILTLRNYEINVDGNIKFFWKKLLFNSL